MRNIPFYIVDVFAQGTYTGNQLAVFCRAEWLSAAEMQQIAKEINFSETSFILSDQPRDGGYPVRIFTPDKEVPFAGHPSLGTAYVIHRELAADNPVVLDLEVGRIPVTIPGDEGEPLWMEQKEPVFGEVYSKGEMAEILTIGEEDIHPDFPVQRVSTGLPSVIVPLQTLDAVRRCTVDKAKHTDFLNRRTAGNILVFCPETVEDEHDLHVRVFADDVGVPEDAATGSANGNLAGYLLKHDDIGGETIDLKVEQGYFMGRPSLLYLKAGITSSGYAIRVGGNVNMVAKGMWL